MATIDVVSSDICAGVAFTEEANSYTAKAVQKQAAREGTVTADCMLYILSSRSKMPHRASYRMTGSASLADAKLLRHLC